MFDAFLCMPFVRFGMGLIVSLLLKTVNFNSSFDRTSSFEHESKSEHLHPLAAVMKD